MGEYDSTGNGQSSKTEWDLRSILGHPSDCLFGGDDNLYCDGDCTQRPVYGENHICRYGTRGGCQCGIEPVGHI